MQNQDVDNLSIEDQFFIGMFMLLQFTRSKDAKINIFEKMADHIVESYIKPKMKQDEELKNNGVDSAAIDGLKIKYPMHQIVGMLAALTGVEGVSDLKLFLISNESDRKFIIGDSPVAKNNYMEIKDQALTGFQSPGLQIICPVSPGISLLLIHQEAYKIHSDGSNICLKNEKDVDSLNRLQILNSIENIFFTDKNDADDTRRLYEETKERKIQKDLVVKRLKEIKDEDGGYREIETWRNEGMNQKIKFSFIRLNHNYNRLIKGKFKLKITDGKIVRLCRNPELAGKMGERFERAMMKGKAKLKKIEESKKME